MEQKAWIQLTLLYDLLYVRSSYDSTSRLEQEALAAWTATQVTLFLFKTNTIIFVLSDIKIYSSASLIWRIRRQKYISKFSIRKDQRKYMMACNKDAKEYQINVDPGI